MLTRPARLFWILLAAKCAYFSALSTAMWFWPDDDNITTMYAGARQDWEPDGHLSFASHFGTLGRTALPAERKKRLMWDNMAGKS